MRFTVITIFPELFGPFVSSSLFGKAIEEGMIEVEIADLRDFTTDPHRVVDDEPYGGGPGMVMKASPWIEAVEALSREDTWRVLLSPQGRRLTDERVRSLAARGDLLLMCGRYEGVDERVRRTVVDEEISIGDFVVAGGEIPAMALMESVSRQVPGVIGCADSVECDSFRQGILDFPHYTRPRQVGKLGVPEVLLSGNHAEIQRWRQKEALRNTLKKRPDLLTTARLTKAQRSLLEDVKAEARSRAKLKD